MTGLKSAIEAEMDLPDGSNVKAPGGLRFSLWGL